MDEERSRSERGIIDTVPGGILVGIALQVIAALIALGTPVFRSYEGLGFLLCVGLTQFLYMGPAMIYARLSGRTEMFKGITLVVAVVFMFNAACWGVFSLSPG